MQKESGHLTHSYFYDSHSNRIKKDKEIHEHNPLNQLIKKGTEAFLYDLNGNLIQRNDFRYTYDSLDRLVKVDHNGIITTYTYDPFNRRRRP